MIKPVFAGIAGGVLLAGPAVIGPLGGLNLGAQAVHWHDEKGTRASA